MKRNEEEEKRKGKAKRPGRVKKVLLTILAVLAALIAVTAVSCKVMCIPGEPVTEGFDDSQEKSAASTEAGEPIEAQEALSPADGTLYQSLSASGWDQTGDVYEEVQDGSWYEGDDAVVYEGTDPIELLNSCYAMCHREGSLSSYSVPRDEARAKIESMVEDYHCDLSDEQVEVLTDIFSE